mgnify:CR=1 FL=1
MDQQRFKDAMSQLAAAVAIVTTGGGLQAVYGAVIVSGLIGFFLAPYFSRIIRFFPPVVTGCVITIIGLSLLPVAVRWMMGGNKNAETGVVQKMLAWR